MSGADRPRRPDARTPLTRAALGLVLFYWVGGVVATIWIAIVEPGSSWPIFGWFDMLDIVIVVYVVPLTAFIGVAYLVFRWADGEQAAGAFVALGLAAPVIIAVAWQVPNWIAHARHDHQLGLAHVESIADEPLVAGTGHPIGVRLTVRIDYPDGLGPLGMQPPMDAPSAELYLPGASSRAEVGFLIRDTNLRQIADNGFPPGISTIVVDFVPAFAPLAVQNPAAFPPSNPRFLCFSWRDETQRRWLEAGPGKFSIAISPYGRYIPRGVRTTERAYDPRDFYDGARAEGARECP